jgi:magnesium-transporting ATPase (P-type)
MLWFYEEYYIFASIIFLISMSSVVYNLILVRKNMKDLRNMALFKTIVHVGRIINGKPNIFETESVNLVPGDILILKGLIIKNLIIYKLKF